MKAASRRFLDHMAWARSIARRWYFEGEDVEQAALLGLHLADVSAALNMPEDEFRRFASVRIRGEAIDHLRRVAHGGRRQGKAARAPREPDPESVGMAVTMGLIGGDRATEPDPEKMAETQEAARRIAAQIMQLPPRTRDILLRRLADEPEASIARDYGISMVRVSQIAWTAARSIGRQS